MRHTPLYEEHIKLGAKMVEFAGYAMPVEYPSGLRREHETVRTAVGLFDVSHMGEIRFRGPKALASVEWLTTNWAGKLKPNQAQYSLMPNALGGLVDDVIVYCESQQENYLLCVNAANKKKDFEWMLQNNRGAEITDESDQWGQIAVQGPKATILVSRIFGKASSDLKPFAFLTAEFAKEKCLVARTGYTGEDGFEIFVPSPHTAELWRGLLSEGEDLGVLPVGLGARDTLRTEMKFSLYGHEIDEGTNPYAAGLGWVVKPEQKDFIGRQAILDGRQKGLSEKLIGFKMIEKGIARAGYKLFSFDNQEIGRVTSGAPSPTLNENIGIGYVKVGFESIGSQFHVDIRGRRVKAEAVKTPFVNRREN